MSHRARRCSLFVLLVAAIAVLLSALPVTSSAVAQDNSPNADNAPAPAANEPAPAAASGNEPGAGAATGNAPSASAPAGGAAPPADVAAAAGTEAVGYVPGTDLSPRDQVLVPLNHFLHRYYTTGLSDDPAEGPPPWWVTPVAGIVLLFLSFGIGELIKRLFLPLARWVASKTKSTRDDELIDAIAHPLYWFVVMLVVLAVAYFWAWPAHLGVPGNFLYELIVGGVFVGSWLTVGLFLWKFSTFIAGLVKDWADSSENGFDDHLVQPIEKTLRAAVIVFTAIMVIQSVGGSIEGILAGLGLGGLAFALAGQETVRNLFGSVTVFADRPFKVGDAITIGDVTGTVESIGFRSTRVRTWDKTEVSIPNKSFTDTRIENISRRSMRRFTSTFGCTYNTTREQMEKLVNAIRAFLAEHEGVDTDSVTVYFTEFGESSLNILVRANIPDINYARYLATVQEINLGIWKLYDDYGVAMPFPTRTVENIPDPRWAEVIANGLRALGSGAPATLAALTGGGEDDADDDGDTNGKSPAKKKATAKKSKSKAKKKSTKKKSTKKTGKSVDSETGKTKKKQEQVAGAAAARKAEAGETTLQDQEAEDLDLT